MQHSGTHTICNNAVHRCHSSARDTAASSPWLVSPQPTRTDRADGGKVRANVGAHVYLADNFPCYNGTACTHPYTCTKKHRSVFFRQHATTATVNGWSQRLTKVSTIDSIHAMHVPAHRCALVTDIERVHDVFRVMPAHHEALHEALHALSPGQQVSQALSPTWETSQQRLSPA
jgi:hypothetical protein